MHSPDRMEQALQPQSSAHKWIFLLLLFWLSGGLLLLRDARVCLPRNSHGPSWPGIPPAPHAA